ncbi:Radical SAM domain protein [Denitrovibrio acetiphilus DSM 12809]|uniref:Radical SAM domain protein n=1 Tax=Denitrovibrio acetiphilus (strain DSM 12809 / NBRC 114555 / N2460) TaxID=522772 RepID=D4H2Z4_DENA2|nr:YgiQ family radical SAM protein [Denitrovibrio acetiphilus]ADD69017.1 Radical SAM domain protein [Denitrovibrio acetiphilus DSM 12809]
MNNFLPTTKKEIASLGWDRPDIIIISGDTYLDSPYNGAALIGRLLQSEGYKTAIIAQPEMDTNDITRLGEPKLFWGVTAGCVDSMVANYTASKKPRRNDDFTPGGENSRRPDRALIAYTNLIRKHFKNTSPIVIAGIEASLRRLTHYDFWSDKLRRSVLFDSKADCLIYGMGEKAILELAKGTEYKDIKGLCYISSEVPTGYVELPPHDECVRDKDVFTKMFHTFYKNNDYITAEGLAQKQDTRFLVQNPPQEDPARVELNSYHELPYTYEIHPYYAAQGHVKAMDTIRNSVTTHRGCYGECNFCAIAVHQGTRIIERTEASVEKEVLRFIDKKGWNGIINDIGGPTANMYGMECRKKKDQGRCADKRCMYPSICPSLSVDHRFTNSLLSRIRKLDGIKRVFIASGIRYDLIMADKKFGPQYLENLVRFYVSGQLKIAPEHCDQEVLDMMGKPSEKVLKDFVNAYYNENKKQGKKQFLTYYMIAAHPGCEMHHMENLKRFASKELKINPEQVQIFTPLPSTYSALMYYTGKDPFTGRDVFVERDSTARKRQKDALVTSSDRRPGKATAAPKKSHRPKPKARPKTKCCAVRKKR